MPSTDLHRTLKLRHWCATGYARQVREGARMTVAEAAEACGTSRSTITRWEAGTHQPHGDAAVAYQRLLVRLADLYPTDR